MAHYTYLIVGGGMAADAAAEGIRQVDPVGSIGVIGSEPDPPYDRPPLSKGLWKGEPLEKIWRGTESKGVVLHLGREARSLDLRNKQVVDDRSGTYTFDKLLLATGGTPRQLAFGSGRILYFRTLHDYRLLRAQCGEGPALFDYRWGIHWLGDRRSPCVERESSGDGLSGRKPSEAGSFPATWDCF